MKNRKKLTYKTIIWLSVSIMILTFLVSFYIYKYFSYQVEIKKEAFSEATRSVDRITEQIDERLINLQLYYQERVDSDNVEWLFDNNIDYSDYSRYALPYDEFSSKGFYQSAVNSFSFVNLKTNWVLTNKGLFTVEELYNKEILSEFSYNQNNDRVYWIFSQQGIEANPIDKNYRVTIDTVGLNLIMHLPIHSDPFVLFTLNVQTKTINEWISDLIYPHQKVLITDKEGTVLFQNSDTLNVDFDLSQSEFIINNQLHMTASNKSDVLDFNYYVFHNVDEIRTDFGMSVIIIVFITLLSFICFLIVSYILYRPIRSLVLSLAEENRKATKGNEIDYLTQRFVNLREDKKLAETILSQQKSNLKELFILKLLQNMVTAEEWREYEEKFNLSRYKYFATVSLILNFTENEPIDSISEDAIYLKVVQDFPESIKNLSWLPPIYNANAIFIIFSQDDESVLFQNITTFYSNVCENLHDNYRFEVVMGVSAAHTDYRHVKKAYIESVNAVKFKSVKFSSSQKPSDLPNCHFYISHHITSTGSYNSKFEKEIEQALKSLDKKQCYQIIDELFEFLSQFDGREGEITLYIMRFVNVIISVAFYSKINLDRIYTGSLCSLYQQLLDVNVFDKTRHYIKENFIDVIIKTRTEYLENNIHRLLEKIEGLIIEKRGDITLTECADSLQVHHTQIQKILKNERGRSFSDYVEEYKLEEAKKLLIETEFTVSEIATLLNYTNTQNFIRFFSKKMGITPGNFRKL